MTGPLELLACALLGAACGAAAGELHLRLLARAVASVARGRRAPLLLGAPLRLAVPVLVLFGLATWSVAALVGGACGSTLARVRRRDAAPEAAG